MAHFLFGQNKQPPKSKRATFININQQKTLPLKKNTMKKNTKFQVKIQLLLVLLTLAVLHSSLKSSAQCVCTTDLLNIGTGFDHESGSFYLNGANDQYWKIVSGPATHAPYPICAVSWGAGSGWFPSPISGAIGIGGLNSVADGNYGSGNCVGFSSPYIFQRNFEICTPNTCTTNVVFTDFVGDNEVRDIRIFGPGGPYILSTSCFTIPGPNFISSGPLVLSSGVYTISVTVANKWDWVGNFPLGGYTGQTTMSLHANGFINTDIPAITDNSHFGKQTTLCAPAYQPSPFFTLSGNICLDPPNITSTSITITPFLNGLGQNTYAVSGPGNPTIDNLGVFSGSQGTYTVTSSDAKGCSYETTISIFNVPTFSITPLNQCITYGTAGPITLNVSNNITDYGFQINAGPLVGFNNPNTSLGVGNYTVTCIDLLHGLCTSTATTNIGFIPTVVASATPPCVDANTSSTLWAMATPNIPFNQYSIAGPNNFLSNGPFISVTTLPPNTGIYTITATEPYAGCTATTTVGVYAIPVPDLVLTSTKGCVYNGGTATITATPTNPGNYMYQINGGVPQVSNQFIVNAPGTYSVTVVSPDGCISVPKIIHIGDCSKCQYDPIYESATWYINPTSSIDFGAVTPGTPIVIDGTLTIDANLGILNNPNVFFAPWSKIEMVSSGPGQLLNIQTSTLKPCKVSWTGILADNLNENITIDASTLTGMSTVLGGGVYSGGVNLTNGALITATNSNFLSNIIGIIVKDVPFAYGGIIQNNIFEKTVSYPDPINGIFIYGVKDMTIGGLANINEGNTFRNLPLNGIDVRHGNLSYTSHIKLYNNKFENIKHTYAVPPALNDAAILYQSNMWLGSAIATDNYYNNLLTVDVDNSLGDPTARIINCDIGISSNNTNLNVAHTDITNTLLGIMSKSIIGNVKYDIHDNSINNAHIGIAQYGTIASTQINNNTINTRNAQILTPTSTYVSTIGIDINHSLFEYNPTGGLYNNIANNMIMVQAKAGVGIMNLSSDSHEQMLENNIYFSNTSADPITNSDLYACFGILNMNAKKTNLSGNYIYGHPSQQGFINRNRFGVFMALSPNNTLECNKAKYTRYGFYAWGDNTTSPDKIKYNKFNANEYPWYFLDLGSASPATFGNVGDGLTDNGNEMISVNNPVNWLNVGGLNPGLFKVFRNSMSQPGFTIFSDPSILLTPESGASIVTNEYLVQPPANGYNDPCTDPFFFMAENDTTNINIDSTQLEQGLAVAQDSITYINYPEVGSWFDKYRLFENLDTDSLLLNSTPDMLYFYSQQQSTTIGDIDIADKKIALLSDSTTNEINFVARFNDAVSANNAIISNNEWEMNEREVNAIKLKIISGIVDTIGYDTVKIDSLQYQTIPITSSITISEKDFLRALAYTCPFVGGNAVYKARPIWATISPGALYDDRLFCIMGQNKNADYSDINIDSLYESQIVENFNTQNMTINPLINTKHKVLEDGEVLLYPNPASTQITVEFKCKSDGEFTLYNGVGQQVLRTDLQMAKTKVSLLTNNLPKGVYTYKCIFAGCETKMGKLTITK